MVNQKDQDEKVIKLVKSLDDLLSFLIEAKALRNIQSSGSLNLTKGQINNLQLIAVQITECAYFISEYSRNKNIGKVIGAILIVVAYSG